MGDARDVKGGVAVGQTVDAGMIAERPLDAQVVVVDVSFEHELGVAPALESLTFLRLHQFDGFPAQQTGERELVEHRR